MLNKATQKGTICKVKRPLALNRISTGTLLKIKSKAHAINIDFNKVANQFLLKNKESKPYDRRRKNPTIWNKQKELKNITIVLWDENSNPRTNQLDPITVTEKPQPKCLLLLIINQKPSNHQRNAPINLVPHCPKLTSSSTYRFS